MKRGGFTLLEVMVAVVILAVGLSSLFTSEVGAIRIAQRSRTTTVASLLARCKMGELEEKIGKEGWPATSTDGRDECCVDAEHDGFTCEWKIERIVLPDAPAGDGDAADGQDKSGVAGALAGAAAGAGGPAGPSGPTDPTAGIGIPLSAGGGIDSLLAGKGLGGGAGAGGTSGGASGTTGGGGDPIASMVMSYAFPVMKPIIEEQVRRATVIVHWKEGTSQHDLDVVQYMVNELPMLPPDSDDDDANNPAVNGTNANGSSSTPGGSSSGGSSTTIAAPQGLKQ